MYAVVPLSSLYEKADIFKNAAKIAIVPAHCDRSKNNALLFSSTWTTCLRKLAARNVNFTF